MTVRSQMGRGSSRGELRAGIWSSEQESGAGISAGGSGVPPGPAAKAAGQIPSFMSRISVCLH